MPGKKEEMSSFIWECGFFGERWGTYVCRAVMVREGLCLAILGNRVNPDRQWVTNITVQTSYIHRDYNNEDT